MYPNIVLNFKVKRKMHSKHTQQAVDTSHQLYGYVGQRMNEMDKWI
jgi:hypothetical protein